MDKDGLANFFLGLGVGVGLGLLFAPKTGEETREILKNKADEGKEFLKKQTADLRENASGLASDLVEKGRDVINRQRDTLNDAIQAGKQAYRDKVDGDGASQPV
jgi:gas vesicle protein